MAVLNGLAYTPIAFDVPTPEKGQPGPAKSIGTGPLDWTAAALYILDPTQSNQLLEVQNIQSLFIDNASTTGTTTITVAGTGHVLRIPPQSQGFLPLIAGDRPVIQIANASGDGSSQVWLLNIPVLGVLWSNQNPNSLNIFHGTRSTVGTTVLATGNPGYILKSFTIQPTPDATLAVAGQVTVQITDSSFGVLYEYRYYIPAAAGTQTYEAFSQNLNWSNKVAGSALRFILNNALATGTFNVTAEYELVPYIG